MIKCAKIKTLNPLKILAGFSLLEVALSLLILAIGLSAMIQMQHRAQQMQKEAGMRAVATEYLRMAASVLRNRGDAASQLDFISQSAAISLPQGRLEIITELSSTALDPQTQTLLRLHWRMRQSDYSESLRVTP